ncbi:uncharacterized protein LOC144712846 isoform X1 [Wolffia australiana]
MLRISTCGFSLNDCRCSIPTPSPRLGGRRGRKSLLRGRRAASSDGGGAVSVSRTQRIMESISSRSEVGGAGGGYSYESLKRLDNVLYNIFNKTENPKDTYEVVFSFPNSSKNLNLDDSEIQNFDVLICGGTLGIFFATAVASTGLKVGVVEKNILKGREQEWNISRKELMELVNVGVLSEEEIDYVTSAKFNPVCFPNLCILVMVTEQRYVLRTKTHVASMPRVATLNGQSRSFQKPKKHNSRIPPFTQMSHHKKHKPARRPR